MKINLIVLPFEENVKSPPICLGYIGSLLRKNKHESRIIDLNFEDKIPESDLNIITTTTIDYYNCPLLNIEEIKRNLIKIKKLNVPVAILGPHVTTFPDLFLDYGDYLIIGEPEITVFELVNSLENKKNLKQVIGLYYKENGKVIKNNPRPLIKNLDDLPFPDRGLMKINKYVNPICKNHPYTMVVSSRGCPYKCSYCYMDVYGHSWRARSSKNVVEELIEINKRYNIKEVWFRDDLFSLDKKRVIEICQGIIDNNLDITWSCQTRVDFIEEETIKQMAKAGCYVISLGIESGSQIILDKMNKGINLVQIRKAVKLCKKYKIRTRGYFIIGSPGETKKTINETLIFAKELDLDYFMLSILTPYPKTPIFDNALKNNIIKKENWDESLRCAGIIDTPFSFEQLVKIKRLLYLKYYFRLNYLLFRLTPYKIDILYHGFLPFINQFLIKKFRGKNLKSTN
jgi:anaerobic magnesium-protoporphyrin IX monomethyl ester cyclase